MIGSNPSPTSSTAAMPHKNSLGSSTYTSSSEGENEEDVPLTTPSPTSTHTPTPTHSPSTPYPSSKSKEQSESESEEEEEEELVTGLSFQSDMESFPWEEYRSAARSGSSDNTDRYSQMLISRLVPYLVEPPLEPINEKCHPKPLPSDNDITDKYCTYYPEVFSGKRNKTARVGHMVQFGFDVDILEIHLNELYDVVDYFFIIESTRTHYHKIKKPLMWEQVKFQDRFIKFHDKIVHFILDDADERVANDMFSAETHQEIRRWQKFVDWNNNKGNLFQDDDIIGFGDTDEISRRENIHQLKHCQLKPNVGIVDIGIWFPFGPINQAFRPDWAVPYNPYTLGDPSYFTVGAAKNRPSNNHPTRNRGQSGHFMLGGMHMSHYGYLPFQMVKVLSCSECGVKSESQVTVFSNDLSKSNYRVKELESRLIQTPANDRPRVVPLDTMDAHFKNDVAILPWFYDCNRNRYPVWESKHDTRLEIDHPIKVTITITVTATTTATRSTKNIYS
ncbi:putative beta-1,4-mannosyl-glycoprotein beta-1,4-N-acetylglucosaminyltransferase [Cavenderia fasciculata]|uniref:Beta-1,4-mannosyl-glycoprotein beta-1,4-N-acetylglucosaminyltransferase n=1 Tax=Cavenderia fasciculata TaxID=261658 RepID=F4PN85_CACFS|nr:putative beta-1,4-mannosyl-glycoprotein beta-1,4-N-acetylglucosaminyltransferase [Cavenderia fasciculata]EGG22938.1 putative beta-1,4-mannosyl-glycoprotein beta-1,4-N-acetylglucosaminyltransferase [Cavenderia fasciculata]|eukprot:XP_004360789.1 putative beta-1,4-mannosyl-glycoprotein beta-1,4-N-acetylglucosaminyltransferase [Cavenderia fasciculata]